MHGLELLESQLLRLDVIASKCTIILREFGRRVERDHDGELARALLQENMVLQAYHFIRVRKDMLGNQNLAEIDRIASPLVAMAIDHESAIIQVRNGYLAHIQEKGRFKKTVGDILAEFGTPDDYASWILLMKGIMMYRRFVVANFEKEFEMAGQKYDAQPPAKKVLSGIPMYRIDEEFNKTLDPVMKELDDSGFKTRVSDGLIQRMKDG